MMMDLLAPLFDFSREYGDCLICDSRQIFKFFAKSNEYGMIFSYVWAFDHKKDWPTI